MPERPLHCFLCFPARLLCIWREILNALNFDLSQWTDFVPEPEEVWLFFSFSVSVSTLTLELDSKGRSSVKCKRFSLHCTMISFSDCTTILQGFISFTLSAAGCPSTLSWCSAAPVSSSRPPSRSPHAVHPAEVSGNKNISETSLHQTYSAVKAWHHKHRHAKVHNLQISSPNLFKIPTSPLWDLKY